MSTSLSLIRVPPQNGVDEDDDRMSPTCQGYSFSSVATPPTILETVLAWPHLQVVRGGGGLGVGGGGAGAKKQERLSSIKPT